MFNFFKGDLNNLAKIRSNVPSPTKITAKIGSITNKKTKAPMNRLKLNIKEGKITMMFLLIICSSVLK